MEEWCLVEELSDRYSAEALKRMLENEGVPAIVRTLPGFGVTARGFEVWVIEPLAHRARWLLAQSDVTERELDFIATGEFRPKRS